jgi:hypothetical protein
MIGTKVKERGDALDTAYRGGSMQRVHRQVVGALQQLLALGLSYSAMWPEAK